MPPAAESARSKEGQFAILEWVSPGRAPENLGVALLDPATDELHLRLRRDLDQLGEDDEVEILEILAEDLRAKAREMGGEALMRHLEDSSSSLMLISSRESITLRDSVDSVISDLYHNHVRPKVLPFRTHLPVFYDLRAAAGGFGPDRDAGTEPQDWLEAPEGLPLHDSMFIAKVEGRSMEPRIPDSSLCIFRANPVGSRQGKILLVERIGHGSSEATVKVYRSTKAASDEGEWKHERIEMQPLNPEFASWTLQEGEQLHVIAEFVDVYR